MQEEALNKGLMGAFEELKVRREPLGILNAWNWAREFKDKDGQRGGMNDGKFKLSP